MVLCRYFMDGQECPNLQKCPNEHLDIKQFIKNEMECAINGDQWPLSCFGPFTEKPSVADYIEDQSFEEVRMMYYGGSNLSFFDSCHQSSKAISEAKSKMKALMIMTPEVMEVFADLYDTPPKEITQPKDNPFEVIGNKGDFQLGGKTCGFFGGPQKSVLSQNAFGFGFGGQQPKLLNQEGGIFVPQQPPTQQAASTQIEAPGCDDFKQHFKEIGTVMGLLLTAVNDNTAALKTQEEEIKSLRASLNQATLNERSPVAGAPEKGEESSVKPSPRNVFPLVITPKLKQSSGKTKTEIKDNIDPLDLSLRVNSISKGMNGSIVIKCGNEESRRKLENEIKKKMDLYDVRVVKLASPRIMVSGIDNELCEDDIIKAIRKQNNIEGEMKLIKCFGKANDECKYNAVIEVDKGLHKSLLDKSEDYFNIGWNKCHIFDNLKVMRCFNCWGFNHNARNCRSDTKCPKCAGEHIGTDCKGRKLKCINCTKANARLNLNLDVGHDSRNRTCHVYLKMLQKEKDMIDY